MRPVPGVLPQVVVTVDQAGDAQVTVDGIMQPQGPVERRRLGGVLASIVETADGPVRVEVRESDGTRYTDILDPSPRLTEQQETHASAAAGVAVLRAGGFLAGETILVAVLATGIRAEADGTACLLAVPKRPRRTDELILLGTVSRRMVRGRRVSSAKSRGGRR